MSFFFLLSLSLPSASHSCQNKKLSKCKLCCGRSLNFLGCCIVDFWRNNINIHIIGWVMVKMLNRKFVTKNKIWEWRCMMASKSLFWRQRGLKVLEPTTHKIALGNSKWKLLQTYILFIPYNECLAKLISLTKVLSCHQLMHIFHEYF